MRHWQPALLYRHWGQPDRGRVPCVAGYSPDQAGLLTIRHAIKNFDIYKRRAQCEGWSEKPGAKVCNWAGVTCSNGQVTGLHFLNNGSVLVGARTRPPCQVACPLAATAAAAASMQALGGVQACGMHPCRPGCGVPCLPRS